MEINNMISSIQGITGVGATYSPASSVGVQKSTPEVSVENSMTRGELADCVKGNPGYVPSIQEKAIINTIEQANQKLSGTEREFEFSIHEKTKQIMVKVVDKQTKEIVREVPSEKVLDMVAKFCELSGIFVDEKR